MTDAALSFRPEVRRRGDSGPCVFVRIYNTPNESASPIAFLSRNRKTRRSKWVVGLSLANHQSKPIPDFREYVRVLCDAADAYIWPEDTP
jgi:hypothetical protein